MPKYKVSALGSENSAIVKMILSPEEAAAFRKIAKVINAESDKVGFAPGLEIERIK